MVIIDNIIDLAEAIEDYKGMFPDTYTPMEQIKAIIAEREDSPMGYVFGISVSSEWSDKCYGFEIDKIKGNRTYVRYLGIWKS